MSSPGETIKNMFLAGFGVFALTRERVTDMVGELVQRGDMRAGDAEAMVTELTERADTERDWRRAQDAIDDAERDVRDVRWRFQRQYGGW